MKEQSLEQKIKNEIEKRGGLCLKWTSPGFTGVPDRIAFLPGGKLLLIEVKRPGLKDGLSTRQKRVAFQLKGLGFEVVRASSLEDINAYL